MLEFTMSTAVVILQDVTFHPVTMPGFVVFE